MRYRGHAFENAGGSRSRVTAESLQGALDVLRESAPFHWGTFISSPVGTVLYIWGSDVAIFDNPVDAIFATLCNDNGPPDFAIRKIEHAAHVGIDEGAVARWCGQQIVAQEAGVWKEWMSSAPDGAVVRMDDGRFAHREHGVWQLLTPVVGVQLDTADAPVSVRTHAYGPTPIYFEPRRPMAKGN